jgi:hypothetical protein
LSTASTSTQVALPKALQANALGLPASFHFAVILAVRLTQSLSNHSLRDCQLRFTSLSSSQFALPKAFQTIRFANVLPFFILVSLHKQACDAALNEKSLPEKFGEAL